MMLMVLLGLEVLSLLSLFVELSTSVFCMLLPVAWSSSYLMILMLAGPAILAKSFAGMSFGSLLASKKLLHFAHTGLLLLRLMVSQVCP